MNPKKDLKKLQAEAEAQMPKLKALPGWAAAIKKLKEQAKNEPAPIMIEQKAAIKLHGLPGWSQAVKASNKQPVYVQPATLAGHYENVAQPQEGMIEVSSSNVHSIGFVYETEKIGTLLVRYLGTDSEGNRSGPGSLYNYFNVPVSLWLKLKSAASKGKFIWSNIRIRGTRSGHKYAYDLTGIVGGYVPRRAQLVFVKGPKSPHGPMMQERFIPRTFNVGEIRKGKLTFRKLQSQLPEGPAGKPFKAHK